MVTGSFERGQHQSRTVAEKQEVAACNDADSIVKGVAPEAEEFLHGEDVWWDSWEAETGCRFLVALPMRDIDVPEGLCERASGESPVKEARSYVI